MDWQLLWIVVLFGMSAWWCCCPGVAISCPCDDPVPSTVSVTMTGWVDKNCDCSVLNATHICDYYGSSGTQGTLGNVCKWKCDVPTTCGAGSRTFTVEAWAIYSAVLGVPDVYWIVFVSDNETSEQLIQWYYIVVIDDGYTMDCSATRSPFSPNTVGALDACENPYSTATCQVN